jgi:hypothetical protein
LISCSEDMSEQNCGKVEDLAEALKIAATIRKITVTITPVKPKPLLERFMSVSYYFYFYFLILYYTFLFTLI